MKALYDQITALSMKQMDGALLSIAILQEAETMKIERTPDLQEAIALAAYLHRNDTRANRGNLPRDTYITHPLRNTLRIMRYYGVTDPDILIASVLHDTVEDHPDEIVQRIIGQELEGLSEEEIRMRAITFISGRFGAEVARIVLAVSNPLYQPGEQLTKEEKRHRYAHHIEEVIANDYPVMVVKFADFYDNAGSLHHTMANKGMTEHLVKKYLPIIDIFRKYFPVIENHMSDQGQFRFTLHLMRVQGRLNALKNGEDIY